MIVAFTSTAFTDWVAEHVTKGNTAFNPYLTFLFYALYVFLEHLSRFLLSLKIELNTETPLSFPFRSAGLSAIRFTGSFLYLVFRLVGL